MVILNNETNVEKKVNYIMFIDRAKIFVKSGDGGHGSISFRREKYVPLGGPDGGDGGRGGDVILVADRNMTTLLDFTYKRKYVAEKGGNGEGSKCYGKSCFCSS